MRKLIIAAVLTVGTGCAWAQTEVTVLSEAQRLACLVKPTRPMRYPEQNKLDRAYGSMRVLLKFTRPDAKPEVVALFNSAREDMQDLVYDHVAAYRLPCLKPEDGPVSAVQDFNFQNHDRDPSPIPTDAPDRPPLCIVMPRRELDYSIGFTRPEAEHLVAEITFKGDGQQPPEIKFIYANASPRLEAAVRKWVTDYRMPCRTAQDPPRTVEQWFSMFPDNRRRHGFTRERFTLVEFLGLTREPKKLTAHFDLKTMGCPFKVDFLLGGGTFPHRASVRGPVDPNQIGFLRWLESLQFRFASEEMANDLFGSRLQIDIPCGTLNLQGETAKDAG